MKKEKWIDINHFRPVKDSSVMCMVKFDNDYETITTGWRINNENENAFIDYWYYVKLENNKWVYSDAPVNYEYVPKNQEQFKFTKEDLKKAFNDSIEYWNKRYGVNDKTAFEKWFDKNFKKEN